MTGMQLEYKGLGVLFLITTLLLFYCKARAILTKITVEAKNECSSLIKRTTLQTYINSIENEYKTLINDNSI